MEDDEITKCHICGKEITKTKKFNVGKYIWSEKLRHYIKTHNVRPDEIFMDKIWNVVMNSDKLPIKHVRLSRNQLMIIDALMKHGGYNKKYHDGNTGRLIRYSEHAGFVDINNGIVDNIIVSGNTVRVDRGDEEIFLPMNSPDALNYKYIFHTHPPTPKPGGRVDIGILYEFPSIGDIFHFIDHHNDGSALGSLIMTPEGVYNIRKYKFNTDMIEMDEDLMYEDVRKIQKKAQKKAIEKYGYRFSTYKFYSQIAQDITFIEMLNDKLHKYDLHVDFYPRNKNHKGMWVVGTVYVPVFKEK